MSFSVMLWLVNPGEQMYEEQAMQGTHGASRARMPGALSGVNEPPAATRLVYGLYEDEAGARRALDEIGERVSANRPLMVQLRSGHVYLVPAARVHYAVMAAVKRPKDSRPGNEQDVVDVGH